ncbi:MAG: hypothetical protein C0402_07085 [Thermodesulfovibrio sp.]|nr:hypothetical protein [Thermodesulfovibrio sp.]
MPLRLFLTVSIVIHILIAIGIYYLPDAKQPEKQGFLTRLVTQEEVRQSQVPPPPVAVRPAERPLPPRSFPRQPKREALLSQKPSSRPPDISSDRPVVPGEGSDTGETLPKGQKPAAGQSVTPERSADSAQSTHSGSDSGPGAEPANEPAKSGRSPEAARQRSSGRDSGRSRLFDPMITAEIAGKDASARSGRDDAITFDTRDYRYAGYMHKLRDKIQSIWVYPPAAAAEGKYGDLKIRFTINKNGRLGKVELVRTSGYKLLDDAAIKALKDGEPYWPLPEEWGMESYSILGHFIYSLYGYQQLR